MPRVLLAWEFGAGLGHLACLRAVGERLHAQGTEVVVAVRQPAQAQRYLHEAHWRIVQAPAPAPRPRSVEPPSSWAEYGTKRYHPLYY